MTILQLVAIDFSKLWERDRYCCSIDLKLICSGSEFFLLKCYNLKRESLNCYFIHIANSFEQQQQQTLL